MRRVRAVRAGLPEPLADDDAAPADRAAPRAGPPGAGVAGREALEREYEHDGDRHVRRRRLVRDRLPAGDRYRGDGEGAAPRAPWRGRRPRGARGRPTTGRCRAGGPRRAAGRPRCSAIARRRRRRRGAARGRGRARPGVDGADARPGPRRMLPSELCRRRRRLPAGVRRTGSSIPAGCPRRSSTVSARAGRPRVDPPDAPGHCCAAAARNPRATRAPRSDGGPDRGRAARWSDAAACSRS